MMGEAGITIPLPNGGTAPAPRCTLESNFEHHRVMQGLLTGNTSLYHASVSGVCEVEVGPHCPFEIRIKPYTSGLSAICVKFFVSCHWRTTAGIWYDAAINPPGASILRTQFN